MKSPQVINLNVDSVIAIDGNSVIDDTDQLPLATGHYFTSNAAYIFFWDLISNSSIGPVPVTMTYQANVDIWTIDVADISGALQDLRKYVANVTGANNMRAFKLNEFCTDNEGFEDSLMRLPYQVEIGGGEAWIRWYDDVSNFGISSSVKYKAQAFEGGEGVVYATTAARVTHRGPIIPA